jgi:iron complex outermembrane receptor protein
VLKSGFVKQQTWSDYYLENASFVRMDNAYLTYSVGKVFHDKANLRLNASCQNVFVITKYEGLDPEIAGGIDNTIYPRPRMYALGINLDF